MTEKISVDPFEKSTGRVLMLASAEAASSSGVSREIRFEPSRVSLVTTC
jgi:hypothetical protein